MRGTAAFVSCAAVQKDMPYTGVFTLCSRDWSSGTAAAGRPAARYHELMKLDLTMADMADWTLSGSIHLDTGRYW